MDLSDLNTGMAGAKRRASPRAVALDALERLLRAHAALREHRDPEGAYGLLRPAREDEVGLIEATFLHCGVPLPETLRAVYRRTLGVGNPVSPLPVLAVPVLRAMLPDKGYGPPIVGLAAFEEDLGLCWDEAASERPPVLHLGHAAPLGLTASRNGLWSLRDYEGRRSLPQASEFNLVFEAAFCTFVDQVLLAWANDLAGDLVRRRDLDVTRGARLATMPPAVREALTHLVAPRRLGPESWDDVQPLDNADLLRATRRGEDTAQAGPLGPHVTVVGLPYGEHPEVAARIGPGTLLRLRPVDDNPHDAHAVEVWLDGAIAGETSVRVGFVERRDAPNYRALPDGAEAWRLRVTGRGGGVLQAVLERWLEDDASPDGQASQGGTPSGGTRDLFSQEA